LAAEKFLDLFFFLKMLVLGVKKNIIGEKYGI